MHGEKEPSSNTFRPAVVISGGQTGVDRAAWDAAEARDIPYSGYVPRGRRAEDGKIPGSYRNLRETGTTNYGERTALNVIRSDATLVFTTGGPGSRLTIRLAKKHDKPLLVVRVDLLFSDEHAVDQGVAGIRDFMNRERPRVLNVAGTRESSLPGVGADVREVLMAVWA